LSADGGCGSCGNTDFGGIAHRARLELESKTGRKVVTGENYLPLSKSKKTLTP